MIESPIEEWVASRAEKAGWYCRKMKWIGVDGAPDRFFAKEGRVVLIEFKRPGGKPKKRQPEEHAALVAAGVEVHVVDNPLVGLRVLGIPYA